MLKTKEELEIRGGGVRMVNASLDPEALKVSDSG